VARVADRLAALVASDDDVADLLADIAPAPVVRGELRLALLLAALPDLPEAAGSRGSPACRGGLSCGFPPETADP
jgi:hypothetical protein